MNDREMLTVALGGLREIGDELKSLPNSSAVAQDVRHLQTSIHSHLKSQEAARD